MRKPEKIALGVAVAAAVCGVGAALTDGIARAAGAWAAVACAIVSAAYVTNRPAWLGKRGAHLTPRALVVAPYLGAFRVACAVMRACRPTDHPSCVAPGLWVGGRPVRGRIPPALAHVVDLVAEFPAAAGLGRHAGYRSLPVLDGGVPPDPLAVIGLLEQLAASDGVVLVHCDAGRGRAPTIAAALLIARGLASDPAAALALVRARRAVAAPTRADHEFLVAITPALRAVAARTARATAAATAGADAPRPRIST